MVNSLRGADKKLLLNCPRCNSQKIILNGHYHKRKPQFFCTNCYKYFYENSAKGYPPTKIPFPVIAYLLYYRRKIPEFSNMREFRKFVNYWLKYLKITDEEVSRHIIRHWIKNYDKLLDKIITFAEARNYSKQYLSEISRVPFHKPIPYKKALKILERKFGKEFCFHLIRNEPEFFKELCNIISKHEVFCWEIFDEKCLGGNRRLALTRSTKKV